MGNLQYRKVTREVEDTSFTCGIPSIDEYVKNSYYPKIGILREGISDKPICDHKTLIAVATDGKEIKNNFESERTKKYVQEY